MMTSRDKDALLLFQWTLVGERTLVSTNAAQAVYTLSCIIHSSEYKQYSCFKRLRKEREFATQDCLAKVKYAWLHCTFFNCIIQKTHARLPASVFSKYDLTPACKSSQSYGTFWNECVNGMYARPHTATSKYTRETMILQSIDLIHASCSNHPGASIP